MKKNLLNWWHLKRLPFYMPIFKTYSWNTPKKINATVAVAKFWKHRNSIRNSSMSSYCRVGETASIKFCKQMQNFQIILKTFFPEVLLLDLWSDPAIISSSREDIYSWRLGLKFETFCGLNNRKQNFWPSLWKSLVPI